jgi:hypothetical protein
MWLFLAGWLIYTEGHPSATPLGIAATAFWFLAWMDIRAAGRERQIKWEAEAREADLQDGQAKEAELRAAEAWSAELN